MKNISRHIKRTLSGVVLGALPLLSQAQTGQALIANPLLSPAKVKEVKRQIAEAAHRENAPPPAAAAPQPVMAPVPDHLMAQMRQGMPNQGGFNGGAPPNADQAKNALSRLQVMAVVGNAAFLARQAGPQGGDASGMQGMQGMPGMPSAMPGFQPGMMQSAAVPQTVQAPRRATSMLIRDREVAYIEGYDVIATIRGDSVRLALASAPNETIFQASVQPSLHSPTTVPSAGSLEKPSSDYSNTVSPDATSMTPAAQMPGGNGQYPLQGQGAVRVRPTNVGEGY